MEDIHPNNEITLIIFPFENLTEGNELDIFCRSFYIDLITELSRFRQFQIVAQESISAFASAGFNEDPKQLKADYIIKGSFRFYNGLLRITAQLINNQTNYVTWADRYEGDTESIFSIQEDLLKQIVSSLQQQLNYNLLSQIRKKSPVQLSVYENWLYGMAELKKGMLQSDESARGYFQRAIEIDPGYSLAYSGMSLSYFNEWSCQLWERWGICQQGSFYWAKKAIELDEQNYVAACVLGRIYLYEGDYDKSEYYLRRALRLNSNDIDNLIQVASSLTFLGYTDEAEELYQKVLRLNPLYSTHYNYIGSFIAFELGEFEKAVSLGVQSNVAWVDFQGYMAAMYFHLGDYEKMQCCWQTFLDEFQKKILKQNGVPDSVEAVQWMVKINPYRDKTNLLPFWDYIQTGADISILPVKALPTSFLQDAINCIKKESDLWCITFEGKSLRIAEVKGLCDIVKLLENPEKPFHCTELIGAGLQEENQFLFDAKAKRQYQKKIQELKEELKSAEEDNDLERMSSRQREYEFLMDHLSTSLGLGGRIRKSQGSVDKARSAVTWRIRNAIQRIDKCHPALGKHLSVSIKTGMFCSYSPEKPVKWILNVS
ncbi:MAG TPA: tetratricopeptide repeat protein [Ohtaekwangia sp.]|nr:tetratricopeptide repeat protein [Ohtaekwangia sp.]